MMIVHEYTIPYKYGQDIILKPLADVHLGNAYCDTRALKVYLTVSDNTYLIGNGDLVDSIITKDLKRYEKHADDTKSDSIVDEQIDRIVSVLTPFKDRIIGLGSGNHEDTIRRNCGTNPTKRICDALGCKNLGYSWLTKLKFSENGGRGRQLIIRGHHGWGGGSRTQGADLTKFSKDMNYYDADIFMYGHVHKRQSDRIPRLGLVGTKLIAKPKWLFLCGTFLKTLSTTDEATYSERSGYPPVFIGGINIKIKPDREWLTIEDDV